MAGHEDIIKHLNIVSARKATKVEATNANVKFDKYYAIAKTRRISKVPFYVDLPAVTTLVASKNWPTILYQFNVALDNDFKVTKVSPLDTVDTSTPEGLLPAGYDFPMNFTILTVKFRTGNDVSRYILAGPSYVLVASGFPPVYTKVPTKNRIPFTWYSNELISKNCVFEIWCNGYPFPFPVDFPFIVPELKIFINRIDDPINPSEISREVGNPTLVTYDEMYTSPDNEVYPQDNTLQAWSDNP